MTFERSKPHLGDPSSTHVPKDTEEFNPKFWLRPPLAPRLAPFEQNLRGTHDSSVVPMPRLESDARRPPRRHGGDNRKVRPSALQKLVKKYDGSGDPFDHIAAFKQAVHA